MLTTKKIVALSGIPSRTTVIKRLMLNGFSREKRTGERSGYVIYWNITEDQIKSGILEEKDPHQVTMQQGAALMTLEAAFNKKITPEIHGESQGLS